MENEQKARPKSRLLIIAVIAALVLIVVVLLVRSLSTTSLGDDKHSRSWLMSGYDAARTNYNFIETIEPPLKQQKVFNLSSDSSTEDMATTIFAADKDNIYTLSYSTAANKDKKEKNKIRAFDIETGKMRWEFDEGSMLGFGAVDQSHLYCVSAKPNIVFALHVSNGKKVWESRLVEKIIGQQIYIPVVREGIVYIISENAELFAIDGKTGKKRWVFSEMPVGGSPGVSEGLIYCLTQDKRVLALDAKSGEQKWVVGVPNWTSLLNPSVGNGQVYVVDRNRREATDCVIALDAQDGEMVWQFKIKKNVIINGSCIGKDKIFLSLGEFQKAKPESKSQGEVLAISAKSGKKLWRREVWGMPAFLVGACDTLYVSSSRTWRGTAGRLYVEGGNVYAISMETGKIIEKYKIVKKKEGYGGTYLQPPLMISNGKLFAQDVVNNTIYIVSK